MIAKTLWPGTVYTWSTMLRTAAIALMWLLVASGATTFAFFFIMTLTRWYAVNDIDFIQWRNGLVLDYQFVKTTTSNAQPLLSSFTSFILIWQWCATLAVALGAAGLLWLSASPSCPPPCTKSTPAPQSGFASASANDHPITTTSEPATTDQQSSGGALPPPPKSSWCAQGRAAAIKYGRRAEHLLSLQVPPRGLWRRLLGPTGLSFLDLLLIAHWFGLHLLWLTEMTHKALDTRRATPPPAKPGSVLKVTTVKPLPHAVQSSIAQWTGTVGNLDLLLLFFPLPRCNFLHWLLGSDFPSLLKYHRWLGHGTMLLYSLHGIIYLGIWGRDGVLSARMSDWGMSGSTNIIAGVVSMAGGWLLWVTCIPFIRRRLFNLFYASHMLGGVVLLLFGFMHRKDVMPWIMPGVLLYLLDVVLRTIQQGFNSTAVSAVGEAGSGSAASVSQNGSILTLTIQCDKCLRWCGSDIIFLNTPAISWWQWHPFTLAGPSNPSLAAGDCSETGTCTTTTTTTTTPNGSDGGALGRSEDCSAITATTTTTTTTTTTAFSPMDAGCGLNTNSSGNKMVLHIKTYSHWTQRLISRLASDPAPLKLYVSGPYQSANRRWLSGYDHYIFVAGGIGATPAFGVLLDLIARRRAATAASIPPATTFITTTSPTPRISAASSRTPAAISMVGGGTDNDDQGAAANAAATRSSSGGGGGSSLQPTGAQHQHHHNNTHNPGILKQSATTGLTATAAASSSKLTPGRATLIWLTHNDDELHTLPPEVLQEANRTGEDAWLDLHIYLTGHRSAQERPAGQQPAAATQQQQQDGSDPTPITAAAAAAVGAVDTAAAASALGSNDVALRISYLPRPVGSVGAAGDDVGPVHIRRLAHPYMFSPALWMVAAVLCFVGAFAGLICVNAYDANRARTVAVRNDFTHVGMLAFAALGVGAVLPPGLLMMGVHIFWELSLKRSEAATHPARGAFDLTAHKTCKSEVQPASSVNVRTSVASTSTRTTEDAIPATKPSPMDPKSSRTNTKSNYFESIMRGAVNNDTSLEPFLAHGRPDLKAMLEYLSINSAKDLRIINPEDVHMAVFVAGPVALVEAVEEDCAELNGVWGRKGRAFLHHKPLTHEF